MEYIFYHYTPSLPAATLFLSLFLLSTSLHFYQMLRSRAWYFIPFVIGGFFEWIGYIGRILASQEPYGHWALGPFILQSVLLLLAPALFSASIYMVLSRIILLTDGEPYSPVPARWLTKTFVTGDVICFMLQAGGAGMLAESQTMSGQKLGQDMITAGLGVQLLFFGAFVLCAASFHIRSLRHPAKSQVATNKPWEAYLNVLYGASVLIMVRSIMRMIEYIQGNNGYILSHEVFLYTFDSLPMFTVMALFNIWKPSSIVPGRHKVATMENAATVQELVMTTNRQ